MADISERARHLVAQHSQDIPDWLGHHFGDLRAEIAALAAGLGKIGGKRLKQAQHEAGALTEVAREQLPVLALRAGHHAVRAGRSFRADPVPAVVLVGTAALLASLLFSEGRR